MACERMNIQYIFNGFHIQLCRKWVSLHLMKSCIVISCIVGVWLMKHVKDNDRCAGALETVTPSSSFQTDLPVSAFVASIAPLTGLNTKAGNGLWHNVVCVCACVHARACVRWVSAGETTAPGLHHLRLWPIRRKRMLPKMEGWKSRGTPDGVSCTLYTAVFLRLRFTIERGAAAKSQMQMVSHQPSKRVLPLWEEYTVFH